MRCEPLQMNFKKELASLNDESKHHFLLDFENDSMLYKCHKVTLLILHFMKEKRPFSGEFFGAGETIKQHVEEISIGLLSLPLKIDSLRNQGGYIMMQLTQ